MQGRLEPNFYNYPPLYSYVLTVWYFVYYVWGFITGVFESPVDVAASWHSRWEPFFLLSRMQSAALGTATVLVLYRMGLRLFRPKFQRPKQGNPLSVSMITGFNLQAYWVQSVMA